MSETALVLPADMDALEERLAREGEPPGYPLQRLALPLGTAAVNGILRLPEEGPWQAKGFVRNGPGVDPDVPSAAMPKLPDEYMQAWRASGGVVDQYGRPIHPNYAQFIHYGLALHTGIGASWYYGEDATVDGLVYRIPFGKEGDVEEYEWLLVERKRPAGRWALPGGHVDKADTTITAAAEREVKEETSLDIAGSGCHEFMKEMLLSRSMTWNAWIALNFRLFHANQEYLRDVPPQAGSDANKVGWFTRAQIDTLSMWGTLYAASIDRGITVLKARGTP